MNTIEQAVANSVIYQAAMKASDELSNRAWAVFFKDPDTKNYLCYDSINPRKTLTSIHESHPTYKFVGIRGCDSQNTAIEYAKALRLVNKLMPVIEQLAGVYESELARVTAEAKPR